MTKPATGVSGRRSCREESITKGWADNPEPYMRVRQPRGSGAEGNGRYAAAPGEATAPELTTPERG